MSTPHKSLEEKIAALYYTAAEARAVLGLNKDAFNYWVKIGKIQKRVFTGKHGVYAKKDIDALAAEIEAILLADAPEPLTFRRATLEDLEKEEHLAHLVFGQAALTPELQQARRAYLAKNASSFWHLYDQDRLVAYINTVPLTHSAYEAFKQGQRGWTYHLDEIEQFAPGHSLEIIIIDFVSTPTVPPLRRKQFSARMLVELGRLLMDWGRMGIEIERVAAASATPPGQRILENAGFHVIGDSGHGRLIYELDMSTSEMKMLREYKQALCEWQAAHPQSEQNASGGDNG